MVYFGIGRHQPRPGTQTCTQTRHRDRQAASRSVLMGKFVCWSNFNPIWWFLARNGFGWNGLLHQNFGMMSAVLYIRAPMSLF
jgi:hypothetical protein